MILHRRIPKGPQEPGLSSTKTGTLRKKPQPACWPTDTFQDQGMRNHRT